MAMMSLRWDGSVIVGMCDSTRLMRGKPRDRGVMDFDRVGTGALARPSRAKLGKLFAGVTRHSPESQALELRALRLIAVQLTRSGRRFLGTYTCFGGVTCSSDLLPT